MKAIHIAWSLVMFIVFSSSSIFANSLTESTWRFDYKRKGKGDFEINFNKNGTFTGVGTSSKLGMMFINGTYEWLKKNKFEGDFRIEACDNKYADKGSLKCKLKNRGNLIKCKIYNGFLPFGLKLFLKKTYQKTKEYVKVKSKVINK